MWKKIKKFGWGILIAAFTTLTMDSCIKAYNGSPVDLSWGSVILMELNLLVACILGLIDEHK